MMKYDYHAILNFWFAPEHIPLHFAGNPLFDEEITIRFKPLYAAACSDALMEWKEEPPSLLALIILFDQFPRNMFRGTPKMFATDHRARNKTLQMLEQGWDKELPIDQRRFVYLPLEHSENLDDQKQSLKKFKALGDAEALEYAKRHHETIKKFGRFPSRNAILGRQSTPQEKGFLKEHPMGF